MANFIIDPRLKWFYEKSFQSLNFFAEHVYVWTADEVVLDRDPGAEAFAGPLLVNVSECVNE